MTYADGKARGKAVLMDMLTYRRPHGGRAEAEFAERFVAPLGAEPDGFGNLWLRLGDAPVLWSAHLDSVHRDDKGFQRVVVEGDVARLHRKSKSSCLGADDAAGVWLLREMALAGVPGLYAWHRGEERGGLGSTHVAEEEPHRLAGIDFAVAFDRRGTGSVITHQILGRCCSDAFADSLAAAIGLGHAKDDGGTFTDTAFYAALVPECTNVSVGYAREHSSKEELDLAYLGRLRDAMCAIDVAALVRERDPAAPDYGGLYLDEMSSYRHGTGAGTAANSSLYRPARGRSGNGLQALVEEYPEVAADLLEQMGLDAWSFDDEVSRWYGTDGDR